MTWSLHHGDCRPFMVGLGSAAVDSIVTDPPYEIGFMGRKWDRSGVAFDPATWSAAFRVLKPGGWLLAFGGARTYHRMACAIEDAGFEIRDQIMWIYGSGFPKGGVRDGKGTCLKPAHEPIVMARKPMMGSVVANEAAFGTGALNIDACRINPGLPTKNGGRSRRGGGGVYGDGQAPQAFAAHDRGRWPANVVHDGSYEVLAEFPASESRGGLPKINTKSDGSVYSYYSGGNQKVVRNDSGSAARFFYCAKASKADRDAGLSFRNPHPTVKPERLMRWLVRLATPAGGLVLDPFAGSGSTGRAALLEGRRFVGAELTADYIPIARARIAHAAGRIAA